MFVHVEKNNIDNKKNRKKITPQDHKRIFGRKMKKQEVCRKQNYLYSPRSGMELVASSRTGPPIGGACSSSWPRGSLLMAESLGPREVGAGGGNIVELVTICWAVKTIIRLDQIFWLLYSCAQTAF